VDELTRSRLARRFPGVPQISAATGEGLDGLLAAVAELAPHPAVLLAALVPFTRGDLVARAHGDGEVLSAEHGPDGTLLVLRAPASLAGALEPFKVELPAAHAPARGAAGTPEAGALPAAGDAEAGGPAGR
jgi:GTP-binding protein HflX